MPTSSTNKLKIGLVLDDGLDKPDGVQQYVLRVGEWLTAQGHEVHYLVGQTQRTDIPNLHSLSRNVSVRFNGNGLTIPLPASRRQLRRLLADEQFDVLHIQAPFSPWLAGRIIKLSKNRTALLATFHILPNSRLAVMGSRLLHAWTKPLWRRLGVVLSVSPAAAAFASGIYRQPSQVVPNAFDYRWFAAGRPFKSDGRLTITFLGRLVPRKGCKYLLQAIAQLDRSQLPDFKVVICGRGPLLPDLERYVAEQQLQDTVEFTGFIEEDDKPRYLASSDISVFPSTGGESFGIVLLEAMASGRAAVLAGNNPGYASVLAPRPELLFEPADTKQLAELLSKYLRDTAGRRRIARWGGRYAREFDIEKIGPQLVKIYKELLDAKNVR